MTAYPYGAALGMAVILLVSAVSPVIEARDNERYAKQQQRAKVDQNKKLFMKYYNQAEAMTFPVAAYKDEK